MKQALIVATVVWLSPGLNRDDATIDKGDARARDAAEQFCKALLIQDLDAVMKRVEVPWCHDGKQVVAQKEAVRRLFEQAFAGKRAAQLKVHVRKVGTLAKLREEGKAPPARKVSLAEVLGRDDRVVYVEFERATAGFQPMWIGIRLDKDGAKVVGCID